MKKKPPNPPASNPVEIARRERIQKIRRLADLTLKTAELVEMFGEDYMPLLDHYERRYNEAYEVLDKPARMRALVALRERELDEAEALHKLKSTPPDPEV